MRIDGDGANGQSSFPVYAPVGMPSLDYLANAGSGGDWYGVVTENGKPVVQKSWDPAPGAYVSATSYQHADRARTDPRAYVDANTVVYIVVPSHWRNQAKGVVLGCRATVLDTKTGRVVEAGVFDFGPKKSLGEGSIACAKLFGIPSSPKNGGTEEKRFVYSFWPGIPAVVGGVTYRLIPA